MEEILTPNVRLQGPARSDGPLEVPVGAARMLFKVPSTQFEEIAIGLRYPSYSALNSSINSQ